MGAPFSPRLPGNATPAPQNSAAAFDAMVRAHYQRLFRFVYRMVHSQEEAEDIVQGVFTRIWVHQLEIDHDNPLPYLYRATRNATLTYLRDHRVRERRLATREPPSAESSESAAAAVEESELARAIGRAVAALPTRCRLIFTMSREQSLSYAEIARILGISVKTVETQMGRALRSLRAALTSHLPVALIALVARAYERLIG